MLSVSNATKTLRGTSANRIRMHIGLIYKKAKAEEIHGPGNITYHGNVSYNSRAKKPLSEPEADTLLASQGEFHGAGRYAQPAQVPVGGQYGTIPQA
jgi:hypothetical protein